MAQTSTDESVFSDQYFAVDAFRLPQSNYFSLKYFFELLERVFFNAMFGQPRNLNDLQ